MAILDPSASIKAYAAQVDVFKAQIATYAAMADNYADALRYGMTMYSTPQPSFATKYPDPPATPEGLTPEQHAAHLMLHDLVSVEEFEEEMNHPAFVRINAFWGAIGKRRFCCEKATGTMMGQFGYANGTTFYNSVQLNATWMAQLEGAVPPQPVRCAAWEKLKGWLRR